MRMLPMPVATLRMWERRHRLTQRQLSPSGQRVVSADDMRRLALVKQLTAIGHAVGSLASLYMPQLQRVVSTSAQATSAQALAATQSSERSDVARASPVHAWRLAGIGSASGTRLQRPALLRRLGRPVALQGPSDSSAQAAAALQGSHLDASFMHEPQLHEGWLAAVEAAAPGFAGVPKAVLYGLAADPMREALDTAGTALLREPQPDAMLAQWLNSLSSKAATAPQPAAGAPTPEAEPVPPRRCDDASLADFANQSPTITCECLRHVAELLIQLSHLEAYSAECEHRNAVDAELTPNSRRTHAELTPNSRRTHADLSRVAAASRTRFEFALEHVALHEGLLLPPSARANEAAVVPDARRAKAFAAARPGRPTRVESGTSDTGFDNGV